MIFIMENSKIKNHNHQTDFIFLISKNFEELLGDPFSRFGLMGMESMWVIPRRPTPSSYYCFLLNLVILHDQPESEDCNTL